MPYPLPDGGPPYSTALRWFLVAVPDDVAFVRAAMGAYTELASYWKWGHEGREPGRQDAAELWQGAIDATLEALEMGFPDILLSYIDGVEALLRQIRDGQCCTAATTVISDDEWNIAISGYDEGIPESTHDTSDPPPDYATDATGETPFSAAAFVEDYLCAQAHLLWNVLDDLLEYGSSFAGWANSLVNWTNQLGYTILRYLYANVPALEPVLFSLAELALLNDAMAEEITTTSWQGARAEWFAAKDDVICALAGQPNATDWRSAMQAIIASTVTDNFIAAIMFGGIPAAVYSLIFEGLMKPDTWASGSCDGCGVGDLYLEWNFEDSIEGWTQGQWDSGNGYPEPGSFYTAGPGYRTVPANEHNLPLSGTVTIKCYARNYSGIANGTITVSANLDIGGGQLLAEQTPQNLGADWAEYQFGPATFELNDVDKLLFIVFSCTGVSAQFAYIDNIRIYIDA